MQCKSCFFIGHREAGPEILPALEDAIEKHISEYGVTEFIVVITVALIAWLPGRQYPQRNVIQESVCSC